MVGCYRYPDAEKCANCGWNMQKSKRLSLFDVRAGELPDAERQILVSWLPSVSELDKQPVCRGCVRLLGDAAGEASPAPRRLAHASVCAACGDSLLSANRQSSALDLARPEHDHILRECLHLSQSQLQDAEREMKVCRTCIQRARRVLRARRLKDSPVPAITLQAEPSCTMKSENNESEDEESEDELPPAKTLRGIIASPSEIKKGVKETKQGEKKETKIVNELKLEGFYNIRGKAGSCAICDKTANQILNLVTRQKLIHRRNLYVGPSANFCEKHLRTSIYRWPINTDELPSVFTGEECDDMIFLLTREIPIDFRKIEKYDPYYLEKWIGMSAEDFDEILRRNPVLRRHPDGKFALAVWLASEHKTSSDSVLASLNQRPPADIAAARDLANKTITLKTKNACKKLKDPWRKWTVRDCSSCSSGEGSD